VFFLHLKITYNFIINGLGEPLRFARVGLSAPSRPHRFAVSGVVPLLSLSRVVSLLCASRKAEPFTSWMPSAFLSQKRPTLHGFWLQQYTKKMDFGTKKSTTKNIMVVLFFVEYRLEIIF
jgi:hypothetical protein